MASSRSPKPWVLPRHRRMKRLLQPFLSVFSRGKSGMRAERFSNPSGRQLLILYNHQTPYDQFFVSESFQEPIYYVATEDIFSIGWLSSVIRYVAAPIPIKKNGSDPNAVRLIRQVAAEGGSIAIAPEGNRTYSGKTERINPSIAHLAKLLKLPIVFYRIEGGYGVEPRWADKPRKGPMRAYVSKVIEVEEYEKLSREELLDRIREELFVSDAKRDFLYQSSRRAEHLERLIYVCPECGFSPFQSKGNEITCQTCQKTVRYQEDKTFFSKEGAFPFLFVNDWYEYQNRFIREADLTACTREPVFEDTVALFRVIPYRKKVLIEKKALLSLYGDRVTIKRKNGEESELCFAELSCASVMGRGKLNLYTDSETLQIKGDASFNPVKYMHFFYRCRYQVKGEGDGEFLGL